MKSIPFFISIFFSIVFSQFLPAQPGSLDDSFGNEGIVIAPLTDHSEQAYKVIVQPDGKILLAGFQEENNIGDFAVARYNASGILDETFGNGGFAIIDGGTDSESAYDIVLQNDGKIILGGSVFNQLTTVDDFALLRLNTDGSPDNTFGTGGLVITDIDGYHDNAYGMALQPDGKILLGGDGYTNDRRNVCVVRYNTNGSLDASFGNGGIAINAIGCGTNKTKAIALQADGKIIAAGYFNEGINDQAFVTKFNSDGTVDNSFGNNGVAIFDIGGNDDRFWSLCILDDAKILAGGYTRNASNENDYLMVRSF